MFNKLETDWIEQSWLNGDEIYKIITNIGFIGGTISPLDIFGEIIPNKIDIADVYQLRVV